MNDSKDMLQYGTITASANPDDKIRAFPYRFVVLIIFCANAAMNTLTCLQFTSVTASTARLYGVSDGTVDWTALVYGISNMLLLIPSCWVFDRKGLRLAIIGCAACNCLGNAIKCFSVEADRFYLLLLGQTICGIGQVFIFPAPSRLACDWFAANDVSKACAVAVMSNQLGIGLGFLVTTLAIHETNDRTMLKNDFQVLQYGISGAAAFIFIVTVIGMRSKPQTPPSLAACLRNSENVETNYIASLKTFFKNKNFLLHWISFGLSVATFYNISTVYTQVLQVGFGNHAQQFGWMGFYMSVIGLPGSIICGLILDKTRRYKELTLFLYFMCILSCVLLGVINRFVTDLNLIYIPSTLIGLSFTSYTSVGYEIGTEITYPESESIMAGMLFTFVQFFGVVSLPIIDKLGQYSIDYKDVVMLASFAVCLCIGQLLTVFIKPKYRRQDAEHTDKKLTNIWKMITGSSIFNEAESSTFWFSM